MRARRRKAVVPAPYEADIQAAVMQHYRLLGMPGTLLAAIPNQYAHGQAGLTPGLADLLVIGPCLPGGCAGFIELKRDEKSDRSSAQWKFAELCGQLGIPYAVTFGRDQPIRILEAWGVVRRQAA